MFKKVLLMAVLFTLLFSNIHAGVAATFPEMSQPYRIMAHEGKLYVLVGQTVSIYSIPDYKLVKKFGRRGEGPQEFMNRLNITAYPNALIINSQGKISYWTKDGEFIREIKSFATGGVETLGKDMYVGLGWMQGTNKKKTNYQTIVLYDSNFKKIRIIDKKKAEWQDNKGLMHFAQSFYFINSRTRKWIYVIGHDGMNINVFNEKGEKQWSIKEPYEKMKVTEKDRRAVHNFYKTHPRWKSRYEAGKHLIKFKEYKPAINNFLEYDGLIYVETYKRKDGKTEFYVFNQKGKLMKKIFLPLVLIDYKNSYPYFIDKGVFYHLVDNDDEEVWELRTATVKL